MSKRIIIMAGGTGGHVFPALAVAEALIEKGWQVSWLGTQKGLEARVVPVQGIEIDWLSVAGVRGKGAWSKIKASLLLIKACFQALRILIRRQPDVVLGMGGFVAGPGGFMAKLLGIPLVIHEQNRVPGTTNRLLSIVANRVLEAFPGSFSKKVKALFTGNPLRKAFLESVVNSHERESKAPDRVRLLIIGGSQGAQVLNETIPNAIAFFARESEGQHIEVLHQTGSVMQNQVDQQYRLLGINATVKAFIDDIALAYRWADLVICRSGAMTVSEVAAVGVPAIFVPLPSAIDDHQMANARYLAEAGGGLILKQQNLTVDSLAGCINQCLKQLIEMGETARKYARFDATEMVVNVCIAESE